MPATKHLDEFDVLIHMSEEYRDEWENRIIPHHLDEGDIFVSLSEEEVMRGKHANIPHHIDEDDVFVQLLSLWVLPNLTTIFDLYS